MTQICDPDRTESLLESILDDAPDLREMARRHFDQPRELCGLAQWFSQDDSNQTLASLKRLCEERADLHLARAQHAAIMLLLELARGADEGTDLARKACNDLLRAPRHSPRSPRERVGAGSKNLDPDDIADLHDVVRGLLAQVGGGGEGGAPQETPDNGVTSGALAR